MVAAFEFAALHIFIGKGLHHTNTCKGVLKRNIYIADFATVFHKCLLHSFILAQAENEHNDNENQKRNGKHPVYKERNTKDPTILIMEINRFSGP